MREPFGEKKTKKIKPNSSILFAWVLTNNINICHVFVRQIILSVFYNYNIIIVGLNIQFKCKIRFSVCYFNLFVLKYLYIRITAVLFSLYMFFYGSVHRFNIIHPGWTEQMCF